MLNPIALAFLVLALLTCGSALYMLISKNLLHAALAMFLCMIGLAGLYVMAFADVMAVSHLLIYVGGVLILILFGIMMTQTSAKSAESVNELRSEQSGWFWPLSMGISIFMGLFWVLGHRNWSNEMANSDSKIVQTGIAFLTEYSFPFELTGVFLLIALVGATFIAKNHG